MFSFYQAKTYHIYRAVTDRLIFPDLKRNISNFVRYKAWASFISFDLMMNFKIRTSET